MRKPVKLGNKEGAADSAAPVSGKPKLNVIKREFPSVNIFGENSELGSIMDQVKKDGTFGQAFYIANSKKFKPKRLYTGVLGIDLPLGGGWAMGRASMLIGERSSGKSTACLLSIAALQRNHPEYVAVYIDIEGTFDSTWAAKLGCDLSRIVVIEPETGEHAVDLAVGVLRAKEVGMIVTDSIAALTPFKETEESVSKEFMGLQARLVAKFVRVVTNALLTERHRDHNVAVLYINQFRMKVGLVFGDPRSIPGGKSLEYSTTHQLEIKNKEHFGKDDLTGDEVIMINEHNLKVTKNKIGGPLRESLFRLVRTPHKSMPEGWVDQANAIYSFGSKIGIVDGPQQSFSVEDVPYKFKGAEQFNKWAVENKDKYFEVVTNIVNAYRKKWNLDE
jgi:recombination protein RecA